MRDRITRRSSFIANASLLSFLLFCSCASDAFDACDVKASRRRIPCGKPAGGFCTMRGCTQERSLWTPGTLSVVRVWLAFCRPRIRKRAWYQSLAVRGERLLLGFTGTCGLNALRPLLPLRTCARVCVDWMCLCVQYPTGRAQIDPGLAIVWLAHVVCWGDCILLFKCIMWPACTLGLLSHVAPCVRTENGYKWVKSLVLMIKFTLPQLLDGFANISFLHAWSNIIRCCQKVTLQLHHTIHVCWRMCMHTCMHVQLAYLRTYKR